MIKFVKIKPSVFLLMIIGLIPILFFIIWLIVNFIGLELTTFSVLLVFGGLIGSYLFWIITICFSLVLINIKNGLKSGMKKIKILFLLLSSAYLLRMIFSLPYFESLESKMGIPLNILIGIFGIISITILFYKMTDDYTFLIKNRPANPFDYLIMVFYISFFLVGLFILHSHVRLLLKDNDIIKK